MGDFLENPRPEQIRKVSFRVGASGVDRTIWEPHLKIGLQERTHDDRGLKVSPHLEVVFRIENDFGKGVQVEVPVSMMRGLLASISNMCDFADTWRSS